MSINPAKIISAISHPLLTPTYALLLFINIQSHSVLIMPVNFRNSIVLFVFLITFVLPSIIIYSLLKFGKIKSLEMLSQNERTLPLLIIAVAFYGTYYFLKQSTLTGLISLFMVGSTMLILITLIINYLVKISLHMIAWGGLFGTFFGMAINFPYDTISILYFIVIITGVVATVRLKLNSHSPFQIYSGFIVGASIMGALFFMV